MAMTMKMVMMLDSSEYLSGQELTGPKLETT